MLKIRLQRVGRLHEPSFRLVLTDSKNSTKSGRFKEILGSYDPRKTNEALKAERINYWLSQGATPTDTVRNLLISKGIIRGKKVHVASPLKPVQPKAEEVEEAPAEVSAEAPAAPQEEASKEEEVVVQ